MRLERTHAYAAWCVCIKMGSGRPGPGLGSGPGASRPVAGAMGRPILRKPCGFTGPLGTDRPKMQMQYNCIIIAGM
jgi:hypothetical protein